MIMVAVRKLGDRINETQAVVQTDLLQVMRIVSIHHEFTNMIDETRNVLSELKQSINDLLDHTLPTTLLTPHELQPGLTYIRC